MARSRAEPVSAATGERVYAGVLGKLIGVYLGRAVEGWRYADIWSGSGRSPTTSITRWGCR